jgi:xanthine dehydrogenase accessory factor
MKRAILDRLLQARAARRPAVLATHLASGAQLLLDAGEPVGETGLGQTLGTALDDMRKQDKSGVVTTPSGNIFVQIMNPPLRLFVVGAVHIAQPLAPMASLVGYDVTVVDPRRAFATDERFPTVAMSRDWPDEALRALRPDARTAVVTLTHDPKLDDPALDVALSSPAFFIAALGSRKTHAGRLERLAALGHGPGALARIHGPAGLAIGAVSPAEIAVAILAQMTAALRGAAP